MSNMFDNMREALSNAKDVQRAADANSTAMAQMLVGRLRHVDSVSVLRALKRELRNFDMTTGKWSKP